MWIKISANGDLYKLGELKELTITVSEYPAEISCYMQGYLVPEDIDIDLVEPRANHEISLRRGASLFTDNVFVNMEARDSPYKKPKFITYKVVKRSGDRGGNSNIAYGRKKTREF